MTDMDHKASTDRQQLMSCLLDCVKQCQIRFGGKKELATDSDSSQANMKVTHDKEWVAHLLPNERKLQSGEYFEVGMQGVVALCNAWEDVFQHGLKHNNRAMSTLKQIGEVTGLTRINSGLIGEIKNLETEPTFWCCIKNLLGVHELKRYEILHSIKTDAGRGRAWLRASLNERTLERSVKTLLSSSQLLNQYYEDWAFIHDTEKAATLTDMAAGLGSVLFAINLDRPELNAILSPTGLDSLFTRSSTAKPITAQSRVEVDISPVVSSPADSRKDFRKKKPTKIVSFDSEDIVSSSLPARSVTARTIALPVQNEPMVAAIASSLGNINQCSGVLSGSGSTSSFDVHDVNVLASAETVIRSASSTSLPAHLSDSDSQIFSADMSNDCESTSSNHVSNDVTSSTKSSRVCRTVPDCSMYRGCFELELATPSSQSSRPDDRPSSRTQSSSPPDDSKQTDTDSIGSYRSTALSDKPRLSCRLNLAGKDSMFLPLDVNGMPVALDSISQCDTTSESYGSYDSCEMQSYGELMHGATLAVARVQQALSNRSSWTNNGICQSNKESSSTLQDSLSYDELKEAVVAMMLSKEESENQNRRLCADLEAQRSLVAGLRAEIEDLRNSHQSQIENALEKQKALSRENDLLKHQLKKYVGAVQLLRQQGARPEDFPGIHIEALQPPIPPSSSCRDYSEEAIEYEKKLVQVAEMHGELIEFNDTLKKQLLTYEVQLKRLTDELIAARGPLSSDGQSVDDELVSLGWDSDTASFLSSGNRLINIWIPSAFFHGSQIDGYHVYQVYIRIRNEEWNVYRRYAEFYELHNRLKKKYPIVSTFDFPPKKAFGKKDPQIVEQRRTKLQSYLRRIISTLSQHLPELQQNPCRMTLINLLPFFSDVAVPSVSSRRKGRKNRSSSSSHYGTSLPESSQQHYMGL